MVVRGRGRARGRGRGRGKGRGRGRQLVPTEVDVGEGLLGFLVYDVDVGPLLGDQHTELLEDVRAKIRVRVRLGSASWLGFEVLGVRGRGRGRGRGRQRGEHLLREECLLVRSPREPG